MDVIIFTETPTADYYRALLHLETKRKVHVRFQDSRCLYLLFLKLYNSSSLLRKMGHSLLGKPLHVSKRVTWSEIWHSFSGYFILLFTRKRIVALFAPYHFISPYLWLLKKTGRRITFMTSWPYWNGKDYVHRPNALSKYFWKLFLRDISAVTVSATAKQALLPYTRRVVQIPHAVDLHTFYPRKKKKRFQALYVGRMIPEKGLADLLSVAQELKDIDFVFVGSGPFVERVRTCGLQNVHYLGEIRDRQKLAQLFAESHVFVLNSYKIRGWEELYGIVLLEALASGTPVISTDCVGPREILLEEFGFLIPQKNREALKEKILYCSTHRKELDQMGKKGRAFVEEKYDIEKLSLLWYEVLFGKAFKR